MRKFPNNMQFYVDPGTGAFVFHALDLSIPAPGFPLTIERFHNSLAAFSPAAGWRFNFDETLRFEPADNSLTVNFPDNTRERFVPGTGGYQSTTPGSPNTLKQNPDGTYTLTFKTLIRHIFYPPDSGDYYGRLYKITDTHNNTLTYYWAQFGNQIKITRIKDSAKRILNFAYETTPEGEDLMRVVDWSGRILTYTFISGWLTYVTDFEGNVTTYVPGSAPGEPGQEAGEELPKLVGIYQIITPNGFWIKNFGGNRPDGVRVFKQVYGDGGVIEYDYDWDNFKTTVKDGNRITVYEYNLAGDLTGKTDAVGNLTQYEYDANRRLKKIIDPRGGITNLACNAIGNLTSRQDALGNTTAYEYHPVFNKVTKITSPAPFAYETGLAYAEDTGDLLSVTDPLDNTASFEYYPNGLIKKITDAQDRSTGFAYDAFGNLISLIDAKEGETKFTYDQAGNVIEITDSRGKITRKTYDLNGRLKTVTNPLQQTGSCAYDPNLNLTTLLDALNTGLQYHYGALNQLSEVMDALAGKTKYQYDLFGNVTAIENPSGALNVLAFDSLDRVICEQDALGRKTRYDYDPYCNKTCLTTAEGHRTVFHKDILCRLTKVEFHDNSAYQFSYDNLGRRTRMTQPQEKKYGDFTYGATRYGQLKFGEFAYGGIKYGYDPANDTTYEYDDNSRLTKIHYPGNKTIGISYDAVGNITGIFDIDEVVTAYEYDELNRLTKVTYNEAETTYEYDAVSNLTKMTLPNGITADYAYDDADRLTRILYKKGEVILYDIKYELDAVGNRVKQTISKPSHPDVVHNYFYDALYRLTRSYKDGELDARYCYDPAGNRTRLKASDTETVYDYNAADELLAANELRYTSDKDGNLISILDTLLEEETRYQYDYAGRLWKVLFPDDDEEIYIYNGDGLRIKRKDKSGTVTNFYWLPGSLPQVLNETDSEGHTTASYILGRGLIGIKTTSGTRYCLTDGLGSIIALTDEDGNITDTYDYDDFGNLTAQTGSSYNPYRYTGQQFDAETGLYYLRARYYDPRLGRFITRDLLKKGNRYVYCGNNPVAFVDPSGFGKVSIFIKSVNMVMKEGEIIGKITKGEVTIKQAIRIRQHGKNIKIFGETLKEREVLAEQIERSAFPEGKTLQHLEGKGTPHFQTKTIEGHTFYGLISGLTVTEQFGDNIITEGIDFFNPFSDIKSILDFIESIKQELKKKPC